VGWGGVGWGGVTGCTAVYGLDQYC